MDIYETLSVPPSPRFREDHNYLVSIATSLRRGRWLGLLRAERRVRRSRRVEVDQRRRGLGFCVDEVVHGGGCGAR